VRLPGALRRDVRVRTAVIWVGLRVTLAFLSLPVYSLWIAPLVVALVVGAVLLDTRASHETLLFANLGYSTRPLAAQALGLAVVLEGGSHLALSLLGVTAGGGGT